MAAWTSRVGKAWNAFRAHEEQPLGEAMSTDGYGISGGYFSSLPPSRPRVRLTNEKSIVSSIFTRLAVDSAAVDIRHVRLDDQRRYLSDINSGLNDCLNWSANDDQGPKDFKQNIVSMMLDKGTAAVVPVDTDLNPNATGGFDIRTMRVGEIIGWYPNKILVRLWDEKRGRYSDIFVSKRNAAIVVNPFYAIMNEPNSTLQRLMRKLSLLDAVDEQSSSGRLDLIIQLPYVVKSEARRQAAKQRREEIEFQLKGSQYGVAYTDGSEKITQLNRPAENNLLKQIEYLTELLFGQLGLTQAILDGTADDGTMLNYRMRTIKPIVEVIVEEFRRKFLTKTARTQNQSIEYFIDPFDLVPVANIAEIADKFTRNEILSSNEIRQIIGRKPSTDPKADQLVNSNMPPSGESEPPAVPSEGSDDASQVVNDAFDEMDSALDDVFNDLGLDLDGD